MTPQEAALIAQGAHRKVGGQWTYCHITAQELADLADAYLDAKRRLDQIALVVPKALHALGDHHRGEVRDALEEIEWFA